MNKFEKKTLEYCVVLLIKEGINSKKTVSEALTKLLIETDDQENELEFLRELKKQVIHYFETEEPGFDRNNEAILEGIVTKRMIMQMIKEGKDHEKAQTDILNHD